MKNELREDCWRTKHTTPEHYKISQSMTILRSGHCQAEHQPSSVGTSGISNLSSVIVLFIMDIGVGIEPSLVKETRCTHKLVTSLN